MSWKLHVQLSSPYPVLAALEGAMLERMNLTGRKYNPWITPFALIRNNPYPLKHMDYYFSNILLKQYFRIDSAGNFDPMWNFWTLEELAAFLNEELIIPDTRMQPRFCAAWALQRYRMLNCLYFLDYTPPGAAIRQGTNLYDSGYGWKSEAEALQKAENTIVDGTVRDYLDYLDISDRGSYEFRRYTRGIARHFVQPFAGEMRVSLNPYRHTAINNHTTFDTMNSRFAAGNNWVLERHVAAGEEFDICIAAAAPQARSVDITYPADSTCSHGFSGRLKFVFDIRENLNFYERIF